MTKSGFDIDELERMLAAATPGEWEFVAEGVKDANATWLWIAPKTWHTRVARVVVYKTQEDEQEANAALIVALHNSAPALLTEIRELRAENARLREAMKPFATTCLIVDGAIIGLERWHFDRARAALGEPQ